MRQKKPNPDTTAFAVGVAIIVIAIIAYFLVFGKYFIPTGHG